MWRICNWIVGKRSCFQAWISNGLRFVLVYYPTIGYIINLFFTFGISELRNVT
jgi:hypothetical protein